MITNGHLLIFHNILFTFKIRGACGDVMNLLNRQTKQISAWSTLIGDPIKLINFPWSLNFILLQLSSFGICRSRESEIGSELLI